MFECRLFAKPFHTSKSISAGRELLQPASTSLCFRRFFDFRDFQRYKLNLDYSLSPHRNVSLELKVSLLCHLSDRKQVDQLAFEKRCFSFFYKQSSLQKHQRSGVLHL